MTIRTAARCPLQCNDIHVATPHDAGQHISRAVSGTTSVPQQHARPVRQQIPVQIHESDTHLQYGAAAFVGDSPNEEDAARLWCSWKRTLAPLLYTWSWYHSITVVGSASILSPRKMATCKKHLRARATARMHTACKLCAGRCCTDWDFIYVCALRIVHLLGP